MTNRLVTQEEVLAGVRRSWPRCARVPSGRTCNCGWAAKWWRRSDTRPAPSPMRCRRDASTIGPGGSVEARSLVQRLPVDLAGISALSLHFAHVPEGAGHLTVSLGPPELRQSVARAEMTYGDLAPGWNEIFLPRAVGPLHGDGVLSIAFMTRAGRGGAASVADGRAGGPLRAGAADRRGLACPEGLEGPVCRGVSGGEPSCAAPAARGARPPRDRGRAALRVRRGRRSRGPSGLRGRFPRRTRRQGGDPACAPFRRRSGASGLPARSKLERGASAVDLSRGERRGRSRNRDRGSRASVGRCDGARPGRAAPARRRCPLRHCQSSRQRSGLRRAPVAGLDAHHAAPLLQRTARCPHGSRRVRAQPGRRGHRAVGIPDRTRGAGAGSCGARAALRPAHTVPRAQEPHELHVRGQ